MVIGVGWGMVQVFHRQRCALSDSSSGQASSEPQLKRLNSSVAVSENVGHLRHRPFDLGPEMFGVHHCYQLPDFDVAGSCRPPSYLPDLSGV